MGDAEVSSRVPTIHYEVEHGLAWMTFDNPGTLNALTTSMFDGDLPRICAEVARDDAVRALIMTGAGNGFCSGADRQERFAVLTALPVPDIGRPLGGFVLHVAELDKPVIAAINGAAAGGGLALALVADVRIAARGAVLAAAYARSGLVPDGGMSYTLPRLIGPDRALRFLLEARKIEASEAAAIGLVDEVVEPNALRARAAEVAEAMTFADPVVVRHTKRLTIGTSLDELRHSIAQESVRQWERIRDPDFQLGNREGPARSTDRRT
jgi:2-(1,2-epoxy-1,2-dihydrophenyl)acetyl-CoA isomerase